MKSCMQNTCHVVYRDSVPVVSAMLEHLTSYLPILFAHISGINLVQLWKGNSILRVCDCRFRFYFLWKCFLFQLEEHFIRLKFANFVSKLSYYRRWKYGNPFNVNHRMSISQVAFWEKNSPKRLFTAWKTIEYFLVCLHSSILFTFKPHLYIPKIFYFLLFLYSIFML